MKHVAYLAFDASYRSLFIEVALSIHSLKELLDEINGLKKYSVPKLSLDYFEITSTKCNEIMAQKVCRKDNGSKQVLEFDLEFIKITRYNFLIVIYG